MQSPGSDFTDDTQGALSLYFSLKPGEKADLEVVAEAAIHWVAALRAAAQAIDPNASVKVEFVDAEEGSLRLNAILDFIEEHLARIENGGVKHWRVKKLAIATAAMIATTGYPTYQFYFGDKPTAELSEDDRDRIDTLIKAIEGSEPVEQSRRKFYRALEKDPSIEGVGVTETRDEKPENLIPSNRFAEQSGLWIVPEDEEERTVWPVLDVTLITPALIGRPRSWRFMAEGLGEFSAKMTDEAFLAALAQDHVQERLRIGIQMTLRLKVKERRVGGVWIPEARTRSVVEVISPQIRARQ